MADSMTAQDDPLKDLSVTPKQIIEETINWLQGVIQRMTSTLRR